MRIEHPVYGKGIVIQAAQGVFSWVKFDNPINCARHQGNQLAVSLNVCRRV